MTRMLPACALAGLLAAAAPEDAVSARWSCEPEAVEVGEPFALVLELEHPSALGARALLPEALALDASWVVLASEAPVSTAEPDGRSRTRCVWRVASLDAGERALAEVLSSVALGEGVTHIQLGAARVAVRGLLAGDEDQPRPLRAFPDDFADAGAAAPEAGSWPWLAGLAAALVGGGVLAFLRRRRARRRAVRAEPATVLARLAELERGLDGASGPERCYALTRLLREAGDALAREPRAGLTDEEWLAATHASLEVPRGVVAELAAVFERAARVKYGGEAPTSWALQETFGRARAALEALAGGAARP